MNKRKIIFSIIGAVVFILIIFIISIIKGGTTKPTKTSSKGTFKIWTLSLDENNFKSFLDDLKVANSSLSKVNFEVVNFDNYGVYLDTLKSAFLKGEAPDLFMLNNNAETILEDKILGISPETINPNDFRKDFENVFSLNLIKTLKSEEDSDKKEIEYVKGVPLGYESQVIFYNYKDFKGKNLKTWAGLNDAIGDISEKKPSIIPVGLGNGSTLTNSYDIITQFFVQEGAKDISAIDSIDMKKAMIHYFNFGDSKFGNGYDREFINLKKRGESVLDLFSKGKVSLVLGYPSLLKKIIANGYNKAFLRSGPVPQFVNTEPTSLVDYNYFVLSQDTTDYKTGELILKYFASKEGGKTFLEKFKYFLPARLDLLSDRLEEKVEKGYLLKYNDFYREDSTLTSFNKKDKIFYDKNIVKVLDNSSSYIDLFKEFTTELICRNSKIRNLISLEKTCK